MKAFIAASLFISLIIAGCQSSNKSQQNSQQDAPQSAASYPGEATSQQPESTASGLKYIDMMMGNGAMPQAGNQVTVHYSGYLTNGQKFDSSLDHNQPLTFTIGMGQVIKGWDEGVATMKVGGKRKLIIPAELGYGSRGASGVIPPDAELIFDVELLEVK